MGAITMTAWRRPKYFYKVIESLKACIGIEKYTIYLSIDGGYPDKQAQMIEIIKQSGLKYKAHLCDKNVGCAGNTKIALSMGFNEQDCIIHAEDDTVFHPDALSWFEHNLFMYKHDERIFSISGYTNGKLNDKCLDGNWTEYNIIGIRDNFTCWGWATWKRIWDKMENEWFGSIWKENHSGENCGFNEQFINSIEKTDKGSWAWPMNKYWRNGRFEIAPHCSYIQNIGEEDGMWATSMYQKYAHHTDWFNEERRINVEELDTFFIDDVLDTLK